VGETDKKKTDDVSASLSNLGSVLKEWDGKNLEVISKPMKDALRACTSSFDQTSIPDFLLCSILIQLIVSYIVTMGVIGGMFRTHSKFPKENVNHLGGALLELSQSASQAEFNTRLMSLLIFAYRNDLLPPISRS
jgi:hypothetical protein